MVAARCLLVLATVAQAAVGQSAVPSSAPETAEEAMRLMRAGPNPRFPFAADTSKACDYWHDDVGELACTEIADYYFLMPEEWNHWVCAACPVGHVPVTD